MSALRYWLRLDFRQFRINCSLGTQDVGIDIIDRNLLFQRACQHHRADDGYQQKHARYFER